MPLYEYECQNCGDTFETILPVSKRKFLELSECEKCGTLSIRLKISGGQPLIDPFRLGRVKHCDDFRETMRRIKKGNPGSNIKNY
jgi:putative FmdB family regulatory protein